MTNREKIMRELSALTNADFYRAMGENRVTAAMERAQCEDCKRSGPCPLDFDDDAVCGLDTLDWLEMECKHDNIVHMEASA